jgi:hypothetical protein
MNAILLVLGAAILVLGLIICRLKMFRKKRPNAEVLVRFYQMITSNE